jgi:hypothetical protein
MFALLVLKLCSINAPYYFLSPRTPEQLSVQGVWSGGQGFLESPNIIDYVRSDWISFHQTSLINQMKENEMSGACSTHGRVEKCIKNFSRKAWREETASEIWTR